MKCTSTGGNCCLLRSLIESNVFGIFNVCIVYQTSTKGTCNVQSRTVGNFRIFNVRRRSCGVVTMYVRTRRSSRTCVVSSTLRNAIRNLNVVNVITFKPNKVRLFMVLFVVYFLGRSVYASAYVFRLTVVLCHDNNGIRICPTSDSIFVVSAMSNAS